MKKALLFIVLIGLLATGFYFGAPTFQTIEPIRPMVKGYVEFVDNLFGIEKAEITKIETNELFNETEATEETLNTENPEDPTENIEEIMDEEELNESTDSEETINPNEESEQASSKETGVKVPHYIDLSFYENTLFNFTYPDAYEVNEDSDLAYSITKDGEAIAYIDVFDNPEGLSIAAFLENDNIVNYLLEATKLDLETETLEVGEKTIYIKDYPGINTQDVYLIQFTDKIIIVQVQAEQPAVKSIIISTIEER